MKPVLRFSLISLLLVVALVAAACGSDDPTASSLPNDTTDEPAALPPNTDPDAPPLVASACAEDEPNCDDTIAVDDPPVDLPSNGDEGLTVTEALAADNNSVVAVRGFLVAEDTGARLCEALAESYPPQCGGASLPVTGWEFGITVPIQSAQGVTWTDQTIVLLGVIIDGTLTVEATN